MEEFGVELRNGPSLSRRRLMRLGTLSVGGVILGAATGTAASAATPGSGAGQDGAGAADPRVRPATVRPFSLTTGQAAPTSYNGWPVGAPATAIDVQSYYVTGTSIAIPVDAGDVAWVLMYVAARFNAEVETLRPGQVWGYDYRVDVNNTNWWSCHASGTAVDFNAVLHPNGASGTFTPGQVTAIRRILTDCGNVVYWGGDFSGVPDEMHFEINVPPGDPSLPALAARIRGAVPVAPAAPPTRVVSLRAGINNRYVTAEAGGASALIANRTAVGPWERFDLLTVGTSRIALRAHADNRLVCADEAGGAPLIANRTAVGPWETFTIAPQLDGTIALRALANGRYVTAEHAGAQPLIANRTAVGPWEKFSIVSS